MAVTLTGDLKIDERIVYGQYVERLRDRIENFNQSSRGAITLGSDLIPSGFFEEESFVKLITNFKSTGFGDRRDPTAEADVADKKFAEGSVNKFRLSRRAGPIGWTLSAFKIKGRNPEIVSFYLGQWLADYSYYNMLIVAVKSLTTAIQKITGVYSDFGTDKLITINLTKIAQLRANNFDNGVLWVMDSTSYYNLFRDQVNAQSSGFGSESIASGIIQGGNVATLGIPVLVLELPELSVITGNARTDDKVFLLNRGACSLNQGPITSHEETVSGKDNLQKRWQAEYDFDCGIKGMTFSSTNANPTDAQLTAAANWTFELSSVHDGPGYGGQYTKT